LVELEILNRDGDFYEVGFEVVLEFFGVSSIFWGIWKEILLCLILG
jgi:hypothetical protein